MVMDGRHLDDAFAREFEAGHLATLSSFLKVTVEPFLIVIVSGSKLSSFITTVVVLVA